MAEKRGDQGLVFRALVDCDEEAEGGCGATFEGTWHDDSMSLEDMAEPPVADITCPECGRVMKAVVCPVWCFRSEAG